MCTKLDIHVFIKNHQVDTSVAGLLFTKGIIRSILSAATPTVDTSVAGLLFPKAIIRSILSAATPTWFIIYIHIEMYRFIKAMVILRQV